MRLNDFGIVVIIALVTALLLSEKPPLAQPKTLVVLVPGVDGRVGAVSVKSAQGETVINNAYASATTTGNAAPVIGSYSAAEIQQAFGDTVKARPQPPVSYMLYFLEGSDQYTPESQKTIETVLGELVKRPAPEIVMIGHTDRVGALDYNDKLSLQREERVSADFLKSGVAERAISVAGRGEREPLVATADEVAEARNRRVEINIR